MKLEISVQALDTIKADSKDKLQKTSQKLFHTLRISYTLIPLKSRETDKEISLERTVFSILLSKFVMWQVHVNTKERAFSVTTQ